MSQFYWNPLFLSKKSNEPLNPRHPRSHFILEIALLFCYDVKVQEVHCAKRTLLPEPLPALSIVCSSSGFPGCRMSSASWPHRDTSSCVTACSEAGASGKRPADCAAQRSAIPDRQRTPQTQT